jgi:hypothetical protein
MSGWCAATVEKPYYLLVEQMRHDSDCDKLQGDERHEIL